MMVAGVRFGLIDMKIQYNPGSRQGKQVKHECRRALYHMKKEDFHDDLNIQVDMNENPNGTFDVAVQVRHKTLPVDEYRGGLARTSVPPTELSNGHARGTLDSIIHSAIRWA